MLPPQSLVIGPIERSETPLLGNNDLLPSWELVSCSSECLHDDGSVLVSASNGHDDLATISSVEFTSGASERGCEMGKELMVMGR